MKKLYPKLPKSGFGQKIKFLATALTLGAFVTGANAQFTESFNGTSVPAGWSNTSSTGSTSASALWKFSGNPGYAMSGTLDNTGNGGSFAWVDGSSPSGLTSILETSPYSAAGMTHPELSFWIKSDIGTNNTTFNTFSVDFYDGATWHTSVMTHAANTTNGNWQLFTVPLTSYTISGNVKFRFNVGQFGSTAFYNDIALDDIQFYNNAPCTAPPTAGMVAVSDTGVCANDLFSMSLSGGTTGSGMTYQWQTSSDSLTWSNLANGTGNTASASQTADTYYRCIVTCSGQSDTTAGYLQMMNPFMMCYCASGATSTSYGYIENFYMGNIGYSGTGSCATYTDNTNMVVNAIQGQTLSFNSYLNSCTGTFAYSAGYKVYIDYNQNGVFTDAGEEVFGQVGTYFQTFTGNITIPSTSTTGMTGMRVVMVETSSLASVNPCGTYTWGETQDYLINILPPPANDAGLESIDSPMAYDCSVADTLKVTLNNLGTDTLTSATVNYEINGVAQTAFSWTGSVASNATSNSITIAGHAFAIGDTLKVWTSAPNGVQDSIDFNDTITFVIPPNSLNGVYTVDPDVSAGADFTSIAQADSALDALGVCGPVTIQLADTLYVEQVEFGMINGASMTNTITITSASGNADSVIWGWASTASASNYTAKFNSAAYINVENITIQALGASYARTMEVLGSSHDLNFNNIVFYGQTTTSTSNFMSNVWVYDGGKSNITFDGNSFINGSYGIYFYGNNSNRDTDIQFTNNEIVNSYYRYAYFGYADNLIIDHNSFKHDQNNAYSFTSYGVYMINVSGVSEITNNDMLSDGMFPTYGFYMSGVAGTYQNFMKVNNNRIKLGDANGTYSSDHHTGFYTFNMMFCEFANNSILLDSTSDAGSECLYMSGGLVLAYNNILRNDGDGYSVYGSNNPFMDANNNNYGTNGNTMIYYNGGYADLAAWNAATNFDSASLEIVNPFTDRMELTVCTDSLYGMGQMMTNVMYDFQGDLRQDPPCIGADEFMPASIFTLGDDVTLCNGDTLEYSVYYYDTVIWNGMDTANTIQIWNPISYSVEVIGACGTATDSLTVLAQEVADLPATTNLCENTTAVLDPQVSGTASFMWSDGSMDSTLTVSQAGTYYVDVMDLAGCTSSDTVVVTQSYDVALPDSVIEFCEGGSVYLDADMSGTYLWDDGSTNQVLQVSASGVHWVEVTDNYGCVSVDTAEVNEILLPVAAATASTINNYTAVFTNSSTNGDDYHWDFGDGETSTDMDPFHIYDSSNVYTAVLTVTNQCGSDSIHIEVPITVSVEELANGDVMSVYPNPATDVINISIDAQMNREVLIRVMDLQGRVIENINTAVTPGMNTQTIDVNTFSAGVYVVDVNIDGVSTQAKVLVK